MRWSLRGLVSLLVLAVCVVGFPATVSAGAKHVRAKPKHGRVHKRERSNVRHRHSRVRRPPAAFLKAEPAVVTSVGETYLELPADNESFDRMAAARALRDVDVTQCKAKGGPAGDGHVVVRFDPSGGVTSASTDQAPFVGTEVGTCIAKAFAKIRIPAFRGAPLDVGKTFYVK